MMYTVLDKDKLEILNEYGLNIDGNNRQIPLDLICELPSSLKNTNIDIKVQIGAYSYMVSGFIFATKVGRYCSIADNVQIGRQNHPIDWVSTSPYFYLPGKDIQYEPEKFDFGFRNEYYQHGKPATTMQHTTIGHNVWIGHEAFIKAGVTIGNGAIIAARAVVVKDVAPYSIVGGNPAKFIRYRIPEELIVPLEKTQWWEYTPKQLERFQMHNVKQFIEEFNTHELEKKDIKVIHLNNFNFKEDG